MKKLLPSIVIWFFLLLSGAWASSPEDFQGTWQGFLKNFYYTVKVSDIRHDTPTENCSCEVEISWQLRGFLETRKVAGVIIQDKSGKHYLEFTFYNRNLDGDFHVDISIKEDGNTLWMGNFMWRFNYIMKKQEL